MAVQDVAQPEELDLTGYHLHDLSEVSIPPDLKVGSYNTSLDPAVHSLAPCNMRSSAGA